MTSRGRRLALGAALGLALLILFFKGVEAPALMAAFRAADPLFLTGVAAATVVAYLVRSWRWGYLLAPVVPVGFGRLFSATAVGFMAGLAIPRAGEVVRPYLIARRHPVSTSAAFATIIVERLVDLVTVVLLFGLYLYVLPLPPDQTGGPLLGTLKGAGAVAGLMALAAFLMLLALHRDGERTLGKLERLLFRLPARLAGPVSRALRAFTGGLAVLQAPPRRLLAIGAQSLLLWLIIALGVHWTNRAFGLDLPFHSAFLILGFLTVGVAVPTPGMVGGFHESYLLALTQAFGVDRETAAAAGIASHAFTNLPVLVLGLLCLPGEGLSVSKVAEMAKGDPGPAGRRDWSLPLGGLAGGPGAPPLDR